ncbi:hypothetical protein HYPSUDRAFT_195512 [Hypholoma sublateritium FD-334 SS-4]|uniref:Aminoglycoside phosphotransferase domain-containing protein n=1 Tax=Hypholoma sublateritium (strain FD-334 SS-4) TaxID=945553 RepID=A0A0D2LSQ6_HYPSF|nr:hypothetical protein HYPSUDRAFT_195512 [Hypholoma sublateritium FD-334 SS-4]
MPEKYAGHVNSSDDEPAYVLSVAPDPRRLDPLDNPRIQEEGCDAITSEKKYYVFSDVPNGSVFIKRNLTPSEYIVARWNGELVIPDMLMERMKNEAATIRYIQKNTTIPTPNIRCAFEDHGRYYIITDIVPGVTLDEVPEEKKATVIEELQGYISQMHALKSNVIGGVSGNVVLPHRLSKFLPGHQIPRLREAPTAQFVMCHNDLSQHNIIVDEVTLKINAILDWEYAGFFPPEFDRAFYLRPGPSAALKGEENDVQKLLQVLEQWKI